MKRQARVLGIDDSPFRFGAGDVLVVGVLVRVPGYVEGLMRTEVAIDGTDSTQRIVEMVSRSRYKEQVHVVMVDGIALAGFNLIDIDRVHEELDLPVLALTRDAPDLTKIRSALKAHFQDWEERYALVTRHELRKISTQHKPLFVSGVGLEWAEFEEIVKLSTVRGAVPEPLRIAHLVASAMARGESYGRP